MEFKEKFATFNQEASVNIDNNNNEARKVGSITYP
jgi:hypothetical protein